MHPYLKTAYVLGAEVAYYEFEKNAGLRQLGGQLVETIAKHPYQSAIAGTAIPAGAYVALKAPSRTQELIKTDAITPETAELETRADQRAGTGLIGGTAGALLGANVGRHLGGPFGVVPGALIGGLAGGHLSARIGGKDLTLNERRILRRNYLQRQTKNLQRALEKESQDMSDAGALPQELLQTPPAGMVPEDAPPNLGDPNFWQGGTAAANEAPAPQSAEEAISLLPAGTFQGLNTRVTAEGEKSTGIKVSPDALEAPDALKALFQAEPGVRVEITAPETPAAVTSFREQGA